MKQKLVEQYLEHPSMTDIYERTAPMLFAYARSRLSSQEEAEDILVEVFLAALESRRFTMLNPDRQFPWLRRVAQHKIIDRYRQAGHLPLVTLDYVEKTLDTDNKESPEQSVLRQEELQRLQITLHRLPLLQQQVVFLHFVDGLRCIEIAPILGKREGTIRVLLCRALNRLRDIYAE
jgi:RNA polymerase sigma factor (sigma-70 family)